MRNNIYTVLKYSLHRILINNKGGSSNFTLEILGRQPLNQIVKINCQQYWAKLTPCASWYDALKETQLHFVDFLPKMHALNLLVRKRQTKLSREAF